MRLLLIPVVALCIFAGIATGPTEVQANPTPYVSHP